MSNDRDSVRPVVIRAVLINDELGGFLNLAAGRLCATECIAAFRSVRHLGIMVRTAIANKVQSPYVKSGAIQFISPRVAIETMRNRQCGRKRRAMNIEHDSRCTPNGSRAEASQEQAQPFFPGNS